MNFNIKKPGIFIVISLVLCIFVGISAAEDTRVQSSGNDSFVQPGNLTSNTDPTTMDIINDTTLREKILSNLESNGVNTSVLRAAISVGASGKVKNILEYYKDKLEANPDFVKSEENGNEAGNEHDASKSTQDESATVPTGTKSPLSPFTALIGIGAAGCVAFLMKR